MVLLPRWLPEYGDYVRMGDAVEWLVQRGFDREHLAASHGRGRAATITGVYDPEADPLSTDEAVWGTATRIFSVTCGMRPAPGKAGWLQPVPESAMYEDRQAMEPRDGFDVPDERGWAGYVVELAPDTGDRR